MTILLRDIWPIAAPDGYKLHFARWNGENQPLEVWARDKREWQGWQEYRAVRDDFNRPDHRIVSGPELAGYPANRFREHRRQPWYFDSAGNLSLVGIDVKLHDRHRRYRPYVMRI